MIRIDEGFIKNFTKYKGLTVNRNVSYGTKNVLAFYERSNHEIYITQEFDSMLSRFTNDTQFSYLYSMLEHEYGHHLYYALPKIYKMFLSMVYRFDTNLISKINKRLGLNYQNNEFIRDYAQKNPKEMFCCLIEYKARKDYLSEELPKFNNILDLKFKIMTALYRKAEKRLKK